jgi:hypothetical protein
MLQSVSVSASKDQGFPSDADGFFKRARVETVGKFLTVTSF